MHVRIRIHAYQCTVHRHNVMDFLDVGFAFFLIFLSVIILSLSLHPVDEYYLRASLIQCDYLARKNSDVNIQTVPQSYNI